MAKYNLAEFVERKNTELGIDIDLSDGSTVRVPAPECWPDMRAIEDLNECARLILGDEQWARFTADGGTYKLLDSILADAKGAGAGESSASSES